MSTLSARYCVGVFLLTLTSLRCYRIHCKDSAVRRALRQARMKYCIARPYGVNLWVFSIINVDYKFIFKDEDDCNGKPIIGIRGLQTKGKLNKPNELNLATQRRGPGSYFQITNLGHQLRACNSCTTCPATEMETLGRDAAAF